MKAIRFHEFGSSEVLRYEDVDRPVPGPGQVLVRVAATSFNPVDDHIRAGVLAEMIPITLPYVPGIDLAGTVAELGADVTGLEVGDRVVAMLPLDSAGGAAEYVLAPAESLAPAPRTIELVDAAALPLTGLAAWQTAFDLAELKPGQTVLVNGAGGAVGSLVVQLAVDAGAHVTAVDAPRHADRLRGYGADRVVGPLDLAAGPAAVGGPFQVVVNHVRVSPEQLAQLTHYVADGGVAASTAGPIPEDPARGVRSASLWVRSDGAQLGELVAKVDAGRLQLQVADHRPVAELAAVHEDAGAGRLPGKTVVLAP
ncbi:MULTISPECIES: NADP-dependent oxidoreductase [unclassified Streptomyces]|uniref:NADP-dependent oxidoreductase n=1 Tax=unclassified Streptomyces TaxID=2593676 RepID=UPI00081B7FA4|nr:MULTISPECIES: NADP-dependent oxidoreductase [unclassified Streptomyces]MYQ86866.1 alcohol dehydrogenase catalytic domain-containing protein [Streptomyces sp. SID4936]SCE35712.1 NADPH:quinone reductase [Streptomyces sp. DvalAA-43]